MDLKSIGRELAAIGLPLLGAALPLPGGAALGAALASAIGRPDAGQGATPENVATGILSSLKADAAALEKAREFEAAHQETLLRIQVDAEQATLATVNTTMQAEAKSDHWPTYSWRPFLGFIFGLLILGDYFLLPIIHGYVPTVVVPVIPENVFLAMGAILGVSALYRGKMQANPEINSDNRG